MSLTIALCDACPSLDVDEMTIALLNIFDSRGMGFHLLKALVDHEVEETGMTQFTNTNPSADFIQKTKLSCFAGIALQQSCYPFTRNGKGVLT